MRRATSLKVRRATSPQLFHMRNHNKEYRAGVNDHRRAKFGSTNQQRQHPGNFYFPLKSCVWHMIKTSLRSDAVLLEVTRPRSGISTSPTDWHRPLHLYRLSFWHLLSCITFVFYLLGQGGRPIKRLCLFQLVASTPSSFIASQLVVQCHILVQQRTT